MRYFVSIVWCDVIVKHTSNVVQTRACDCIKLVFTAFRVLLFLVACTRSMSLARGYLVFSYLLSCAFVILIVLVLFFS